MDNLEEKLKKLSSEERNKRINELARKKKESGLTEEEKKEQHILRQIFLKNFRRNMKAQLDRIKFKAILILIIPFIAISIAFLLNLIDKHSNIRAAIPDNIIRVYLETYGNPKSIPVKKVGSYKINNSRSLGSSGTIKVSGEKIVFAMDGKTYSYSAPVNLNTTYYNTSNYLTLNNHYSYVGNFELRIKNGGLQIINYVDMENYTKGVVPYEMSDGNPYEALKAQAIAARTEGYYNKAIARDDSLFDVYNNTKDQMYLGFNLDYENVIKAVNATKNKLLYLKSNNKVIFSPYGASNGGYVEYSDSSQVAGSNLAYMPYKSSDPYDLKASLASNTYSARVTIPKNLSISKLNSSTAQPYKFLRDKLKPIVIADNKTITNLEYAKVTKITLTYPSYSDHGKKRAFDAATIAVKIKYKNVEMEKTVNLIYTPYVYKSGGVKYERPFINKELNLSDKLKFILLYTKDQGDSFLLASMRYGHGSGMSQIGAIEMAKQKKTYIDILKFYYSYGNLTKIVTKNWSVPASANDSNTLTSKFVKTNNYGKTGQVINVAGSYLNLRKSATTSSNSLLQLKNNTKVKLLTENNNWFKAQIKVGSKIYTGYVSKKYIKVLATKTTTEKLTTKFVKTKNYGKSAKVVNVGNSYLNLRKSATTSSKSLKKLKNGTKLSIRKENKSWFQVVYKSGSKSITGYVSRKYIKLT